MLEKTTEKYWLGRDGEKHIKLCLDVSQSSEDLALFSVDMYLPGECYISFSFFFQNGRFDVSQKCDVIFRNFKN